MYEDFDFTKYEWHFQNNIFDMGEHYLSFIRLFLYLVVEIFLELDPSDGNAFYPCLWSTFEKL